MKECCVTPWVSFRTWVFVKSFQCCCRLNPMSYTVSLTDILSTNSFRFLRTVGIIVGKDGCITTPLLLIFNTLLTRSVKHGQKIQDSVCKGTPCHNQPRNRNGLRWRGVSKLNGSHHYQKITFSMVSTNFDTAGEVTLFQSRSFRDGLL